MDEKEEARKLLREHILEVSKKHNVIAHSDNGEFACGNCFITKDSRYTVITNMCIRFDVGPSEGADTHKPIPVCKIMPHNCTSGRHGHLLTSYEGSTDPRAYIDELKTLLDVMTAHE